MPEGQNSGDSASQSLTVDSAATALEGLLSDETEEQEPATRTDDKTPAAQSSSEDKGEEHEPEAEEKSDSDEEEPTEPEEGEADEPADDDEQPITKHKVKVAGADEEVTLDELKKGYSREKDYTQKSQKLAEERRHFEAEAKPEREAVRAERQRYASQLSELETTLKALAQEPDWETLRRESPDLFADTWAAWNEHTKRVNAISQERAAADAKVRKDFEAQQKEHLTGESEKLFTAIPAWNDKEVRTKEVADILTYGKTLGFSEDDIRGVTDHRALVTLRKAMLFDRAQEAADKAKQTATAKIEKVRTAAPGAKGSKAKVSDTTRAKQRHAKVGSVDSAANALELMLDD